MLEPIRVTWVVLLLAGPPQIGRCVDVHVSPGEVADLLELERVLLSHSDQEYDEISNEIAEFDGLDSKQIVGKQSFG